ncbi:hypothetical protein HK405_005585, partial [Cladochytrium tenue]
KRAKLTYVKLWALHVDSRTADRRAKLARRPQKEINDRSEREIDEILAKGGH